MQKLNCAGGGKGGSLREKSYDPPCYDDCPFSTSNLLEVSKHLKGRSGAYVRPSVSQSVTLFLSKPYSGPQPVTADVY